MINTQSNRNGKRAELILSLAHAINKDLGIERSVDDVRAFSQAEPYIQISRMILPECSSNLCLIDSDPYLTQTQKIQGVISLLSSLLESDLSHISPAEIANAGEGHIINLLQLLRTLSTQRAKASGSFAESGAKRKRGSCSSGSHAHNAVMGSNKQFNVHKNDEDRRIKQASHKERNWKAEAEQDSESDFPIKPISKEKRSKGSKAMAAVKLQQNRPSALNTERKGGKESDLTSTASSHTLSKEMGLRYRRLNGQMIGIVRQLFTAQHNLQVQRGNQLQDLFVKEQRQLKQQGVRSARKIEREARQRKQLIERRMDDRSKMLQSLEGQHFSQNIHSIFRREGKVRREQREEGRRREEKQAKEVLNFGGLDDLLRRAINSNSLQSSLRNK